MARPRLSQLRFAALYMNGPSNVRGQWNACAMAAGMPEPPSRDDKMLRRMIEEKGGVVGPTDAPAALPDLAELLAASESGEIPWQAMRDKLTTVMQDVAGGKVKASAAQVSMLKYIVEQANTAQATDDVVHNVMILPTQGKDNTLQIDEVWRKRLHELERPNE